MGTVQRPLGKAREAVHVAKATGMKKWGLRSPESTPPTRNGAGDDGVLESAVQVQTLVLQKGGPWVKVTDDIVAERILPSLTNGVVPAPGRRRPVHVTVDCWNGVSKRGSHRQQSGQRHQTSVLNVGALIAIGLVHTTSVSTTTQAKLAMTSAQCARKCRWRQREALLVLRMAAGAE